MEDIITTTTTTTSQTIICPLVRQKRQHGSAVWCVPRWAAKAHKTKSLYQWLRVQMRGTLYTLHYILSKGAMKCVWDIVSVHVFLHGISDYQCSYKVSTNEFCQRQLWTWWNGQRGYEKLALCGLGRCCIATPASFYTRTYTCLTCAVRVRKNPGLRSITSAVLEAEWSAPEHLPTQACYQQEPNEPTGAWHREMIVLPFPRALFLLQTSFPFRVNRLLESPLAC